MEIGSEKGILNIIIIKIDKLTLVNLKIDLKLKNRFIKKILKKSIIKDDFRQNKKNKK